MEAPKAVDRESVYARACSTLACVTGKLAGTAPHLLDDFEERRLGIGPVVALEATQIGNDSATAMTEKIGDRISLNNSRVSEFH
jgi:hypothetical protein